MTLIVVTLLTADDKIVECFKRRELTRKKELLPKRNGVIVTLSFFPNTLQFCQVTL